jgi:hypothetical protein
MTDLHVVKFLKEFEDKSNALTQLKDKYGISINFHSLYPNLVQFKYDQINSPTGHDIVRECRGLILDMDADWTVVAYPFKRFFSNGEHHAAKIDWKTAKFWEKIDGSLMFVYFYDDVFNVASSGLPDARGDVSDKSMTFSELFWKTWMDRNYDLPDNHNYTYIFEMTSPLTQVLVPHVENHIRLIGVRDLTTMQEVDINTITKNWEKVKCFPVASIEEAEALCQTMNPMEQEGFVITDAKFNRVKLKSPQYAAISHLGLTPEEIQEKGLRMDKYDGNTQERWMLKVIMTNECAEFLTYYPQYKSLYEKVYSRYVKLVSEMEVLYASIKDITNQFEYASHVKDHPMSGVFFQLKAGRIATVKDGIKNTDPAKLQKILKGIK